MLGERQKKIDQGLFSWYCVRSLFLSMYHYGPSIYMYTLYNTYGCSRYSDITHTLLYDAVRYMKIIESGGQYNLCINTEYKYIYVYMYI